MLVSSHPLFWSCTVVWGLLGAMWFWGQITLTCICAISTVLEHFAPCPPALSGKYEVSIMVPLFFAVWRCLVVAAHRVVMVTLQLSSCAQGRHGYPTRSVLVLEAPLSFQAPYPSSSIVDEFNMKWNFCLLFYCRKLKSMLHWFIIFQFKFWSGI